MNKEILPNDPREKISDTDYIAFGRKPSNFDLTDASTWTALVSAVFTIAGAFGIKHDEGTVTAISAVIVFAIKFYNMYRPEWKEPKRCVSIPPEAAAKVDIKVASKDSMGTNADAIITVTTGRDDIH